MKNRRQSDEHVTIYRRTIRGVPCYFVRDDDGEWIAVPPVFVREHLPPEPARSSTTDVAWDDTVKHGEPPIGWVILLLATAAVVGVVLLLR